MSTLEKIGYLLINLGTPASTSVVDVKKYLGEFLMDPYVINAPWIIRRLIVSCFILPFRPKSTAEAYKMIWTEEGSPLLFNTQKLKNHLQGEHNLNIEIAMRYGSPSISDALESFEQQKIKTIHLLPLYPQFCDATVTTSIKEVRRKNIYKANLSVIPAFYASDAFIKSSKTVIKEHFPDDFDHLLFSYHSLPESQIKKSDKTGNHCLNKRDCCSTELEINKNCYRHQCAKTSSLIAKALNINDTSFSTSFQSKLGPVPWLKPSTETALEELAQAGVKKLVVACPSFVADNLETLEEIGERGKETFIKSGGEELTLIPCLNDHPSWVSGLANILIDHSTKDASAVTSA
ncbi:ferrochelatase [Gammaproteobacteria bacterium]|nr:ferrochelatase [Gammaproteobacteria bacterium]